MNAAQRAATDITPFGPDILTAVANDPQVREELIAAAVSASIRKWGGYGDKAREFNARTIAEPIVDAFLAYLRNEQPVGSER